MIDDINFLNMTKKECLDAGAYAAILEIEEGREDLLKAYIWAKSACDYLTAFTNKLHDEALRDFENHGEKEVEIYGRKISKMEAGTKYDFSGCGHPDLETLEKGMNAMKSNLNFLRNEIKAMTEKRSFFNEETGEVYEVKPPIKTSTTKIKITY